MTENKRLLVYVKRKQRDEDIQSFDVLLQNKKQRPLEDQLQSLSLSGIDKSIQEPGVSNLDEQSYTFKKIQPSDQDTGLLNDSTVQLGVKRFFVTTDDQEQLIVSNKKAKPLHQGTNVDQVQQNNVNNQKQRGVKEDLLQYNKEIQQEQIIRRQKELDIQNKFGPLLQEHLGQPQDQQDFQYDIAQYRQDGQATLIKNSKKFVKQDVASYNSNQLGSGASGNNDNEKITYYYYTDPRVEALQPDQEQWDVYELEKPQEWQDQQVLEDYFNEVLETDLQGEQQNSEHDSDDSNAESYYANTYPDESDGSEDFDDGYY